jgi:hypothetical protein
MARQANQPTDWIRVLVHLARPASHRTVRRVVPPPAGSLGVPTNTAARSRSPVGSFSEPRAAGFGRGTLSVQYDRPRRSGSVSLNARRTIGRLAGSSRTLSEPVDGPTAGLNARRSSVRSTDRHLTERLFGLRIPVVNPQRGLTVERPERPLPSPASDPRRSGPTSAVTSATTAAQAAQHATVRERREIEQPLCFHVQPLRPLPDAPVPCVASGGAS